MADEEIDIYDEALNPKGTALKSVAHQTGLWHKSIHCWIVKCEEDDGSVLFQKRSAEKDLFPDALDISAAGHYQTGEQVADGVREIMEELGLQVRFEQLVPLGIKFDLGLFNDIINHEFCETFLLREDKPISDYELDLEEVEGLVEINISDGLKLFSGEASQVEARGVEYDRAQAQWRNITKIVTQQSFIPRIDPYYYKIFIMADLLVKGYKHLAI